VAAISRSFASLPSIWPAASKCCSTLKPLGSGLGIVDGICSVAAWLREEHHIPADAVRFTWLSPGDTRAAFASHQVDAWACWTPYASTAIKEGARVVADGQKLIWGYAFEVANEQAIADRKALLADFLRREAKALDWAATHQAEYARTLAAETGLPPDIALVMVEKNGRRSVPIDQRVIEDQNVVLKTFADAGEIRTDRPLEKAFSVI